MRRALAAVFVLAVITGCGPDDNSTGSSKSTDESICLENGRCVDPPTAHQVETDLEAAWRSANTTVSGEPYPIDATFDPATEVLAPVAWDADGDPNNGGGGEVKAWPVRVWATYVVDKGDGTPDDDTFYAGCLGDRNTTGDTQKRIVYMVPQDDGSVVPHTGAESDEVSCED